MLKIRLEAELGDLPCRLKSVLLTGHMLLLLLEGVDHISITRGWGRICPSVVKSFKRLLLDLGR